MAILDKNASQSIKGVLFAVLKVWGGLLTGAAFVLATVAVLRVCNLASWVAWLPGGRIGFMDMMLVCGMIAAARYAAREQ